MQKRIAVVPARGGSKRIYKKNIKFFLGNPIISYTLNTLTESKLFDKIHISTDDLEIKRVVEDLNFKIDFLRDPALADDTTPIMPVIRFVLKEYKKLGLEYEQVWIVMPCSPLLESKDLIAANELFERNDRAFPVLAVSEYPAPIEWAFDLSKDSRLTALNEGMFAKDSKQLIPKYFDAGSFFIWATHDLNKTNGAGTDRDLVGYVIPKSKCVDIDDEEDWRLAEALYASRPTKSKIS